MIRGLSCVSQRCSNVLIALFDNSVNSNRGSRSIGCPSRFLEPHVCALARSNARREKPGSRRATTRRQNREGHSPVHGRLDRWSRRDTIKTLMPSGSWRDGRNGGRTAVRGSPIAQKIDSRFAWRARDGSQTGHSQAFRSRDRPCHRRQLGIGW
jgi:hypothetical protein